MKSYRIRAMVSGVAWATGACLSLWHAQADSANRPPTVSILYPRWGDDFSASAILVKIKAYGGDRDGFITQMQFLAGTNLIGVVTNPPFNVLWKPSPPCYRNLDLKAIALDNLGAETESTPVRVNPVCGRPPFPVLEIISPRDGAFFDAPATFVFSAELLASTGDTGPVEFFVGTNSVGLADQGGIFTAATPPSSIIVSNLAEGEYKLSVRYRGGDGVYCTCNWITNTIRVVKLGVESPGITPDRRLRFEVLTSFPGNPTIIEASPNLRDWFPLSTNYPSSNTFTFTESSPASNAQRFYRVFLPRE